MEFEKYHKLKRLGDDENKDIFAYQEDEIIVEEKIDGGNFRVYIHNGNVVFGSRTQQLTEENSPEKELARAKNFRKCINFVWDKLKDKNLKEYNLILYGECCVKHSLSYDWDIIPPFLGFDIKTEDGVYLDYDRKVEIFKELGLPVVPLVARIKAKDVILPITDEFVPNTTYPSIGSTDLKAEGVVFKNYEKQLYGKYVRDAFKELNSRTFGGNPKYNKVDDTNNSEFVFKYCTNARIEKLILKKLDEGNKLSMKLMGELIRDTYLDIIEEEWKEILTSNWKLDFQKIRKSIAPRVRAVLEQVIDNNLIQIEE